MQLTRFQKLMLAVTAGMFVFFGLLMIVFRTHPRVLFEESLLKTTEYENQTVYSGKAHGTPVTITVARAPGNAVLTTVDFTIGTEIHDVCEVEYPLEQIQTEFGYPVDGIRVTKNGEVLWEGGYDPDNEIGQFDADGKWGNLPLGQGVMDWAKLLPRMRECFDSLCVMREGLFPALAAEEYETMRRWHEGV